MEASKTITRLLIAILSVLLALGVGAQVRAQSPNQVGLVVQFGDGAILTRCVAFNEPEISGYDVLMRSGLNVVANTTGLGVTVCKIQEQGCPAENCFCACQGATCTYWSYWHLDGDSWRYAYQGAISHVVRHGDVEGWRWGNEASPPDVSFEQICAPATNTPPPTFTFVPPTLTPTATAMATHTPAQVQPPPTTALMATSTASTTRKLPAPATPLFTPTPSPLPASALSPTPVAQETRPMATVTAAATTVATEGPGGQGGYLFYGIGVVFILAVLVMTLRRR